MTKKSSNLLFIIILALSSALLTYWFLINYDTAIAVLSMLISAGCAVMVYLKKKETAAQFLREHQVLAVLLAAFLFYMLCFIQSGKSEDILFLGVSLFQMPYLFIAFPALYFYGIIAADCLFHAIQSFINSMDDWDKKSYPIISIVIALLIIVFYINHSDWYEQFDKVYSIDSGWCFHNIFPKFSYYDIRHPLLSVYTFPIYTLISLINTLFVPESMWTVTCAVGIQLFNSQLLILMGFLIKKMTDNSKEMLLFFLSSYSVVMYFFFLEKYQLCTFLLVAYVYYQCVETTKQIKSTKGLAPAYISAAFVMPTSGFLGFSWLLTHKPWKEKIEAIWKTVLASLLAMICLGRGNTLLYGFSEATGKVNSFGGGEWLYSEKLVSFSKLWQGVFFPVNAGADGKRYFWIELTNQYEWAFFVILLLALIGIFLHRKEHFIQTSVLWLTFSFILVVVIQWSVKESPLFSLYFTWALLPAVKYGMDYLIDHLKVRPALFYGIITAFMLLLDIIDLSRILAFFQ
ncbi:MAG: hypothetical protein ACI4C1_10140 [Lachnospiraceae bacterium]